ncbi:MAG: hypothetical protein HZC55_15025 [Verrucomicrobia bacterium]|nr:hypothetical protein [Verrucomicrobiota bacterium]
MSLETSNAWPHWIESVWPEDDQVLWGWYHCEPVGLFPDSTLTAPKIGAVVSLDGGRTLRDLGIVLESGDPLDPTAQNGYFAGGHGDFTVMLDRERKYFYFFFDNYGGAKETQGVCVARLAFEDRANPVGKVWKYHDGQWKEPGLGGKMTPILPVVQRWQSRAPDALWGPSVHWNTHLNCFVMLLNRAQGEPGWSQEGVYVSFSSDLSRPGAWTTPRKILDREEFPGWYFFYPQVMGLEAGGSDRRAGATARLYVGGISKWEIDFIAPPGPPSSLQVNGGATALTAAPGETVALTATTAGSAPFSYQWFKDGVALPQATAATFTLAAASPADAGAYWVTVTNPLGSAESPHLSLAVVVPPAPTPAPAPPPEESFLSNLAVRAVLPSEEAVLTLGFVTQSTAAKTLLLRAVGPTLAQFGVENPAADARLEVYDAAAVRIGANEDWAAEEAEAFAAVGAFALPSGSADAALRLQVPAGAATAQVRTSGGGAVLAEIYDPLPTSRSKVVNFSTRGLAGEGSQVLVVGLSVGGTGSKRVLIRALGPQLAAYGVVGAAADPSLEVLAANQTRLAASDDWSPELQTVFAAAGAPALVPGSRDAAVALTLAAGSRCTVVVRSADGLPGEVLCEIYELP